MHNTILLLAVLALTIQGFKLCTAKFFVLKLKEHTDPYERVCVNRLAKGMIRHSERLIDNRDRET